MPNITPNPASVPYFKVTKVFKDQDTAYKGLVMHVHRHKCRVGYCQKKIKGVVQPCRFGFPKDLVPETTLETKKDAKGRETVELNLKRNDPWVNSHIQAATEANRGNCDAQAVADEGGIVGYIAKYISKPEVQEAAIGYVLGLIAKSALPLAYPVRSLAQRALIRIVSERDYSAQETMHLIMSLKLVRSSRIFMPLVLEGSHEVRKNDDGESIILSNAVENYCERPASMSKMSLMQLYRTHRWDGNTFTRRKDIHKKETEAIVVPKGFKKVPKESPLYREYCRKYLMLHTPFRSVDQLKDPEESFEQAYEDFVKNRDSADAFYEDIEDRVDAQEQVVDSGDEELDGQPEKMMMDYDMLTTINPKFKEIGDIDRGHDWSASYREDPAKYDQLTSFHQQLRDHRDVHDAPDDVSSYVLNPEQEVAFRKIQSHFSGYQSGIPAQLLHIVTGSAGTGKTVFIKKLKHLLGDKLMIMAPTGVAALNAKGSTVNSGLKIPALMGEKNFLDLAYDSLEELQEKMKCVTYIILEEVSMIGLRKLAMIDSRLRQAFPQDETVPFGGRNVILIGDFGQLPPIGDPPLYRYASAPWDSVAKKLTTFIRHGLLLYQQFNSCSRFKTAIRQSGDAVFRDMLQRIRVGKATPEDFDLLSSRFLGRANNEDDFQDAAYLFSKKEKVQYHNLDALKQLEKPIARIVGTHSGGKGATKVKSSDAGGLESVVLLASDARVMLTSNISVSSGLCNGTVGTVVDIIYRTGTESPGLPLCVLVKFDNYTGPVFDPDQPNVIPICPITRRFTIGSSSMECSRTNIPLTLAWAITVHKSQGLTLPKAVIDIGSSDFSTGLSFVALSRVRKLSDLLLVKFDSQRLLNLNKNQKNGRGPLDDLIAEDERLEAMSRGEVGSMDLSRKSSADVHDGIPAKRFKADLLSVSSAAMKLDADKKKAKPRLQSKKDIPPIPELADDSINIKSLAPIFGRQKRNRPDPTAIPQKKSKLANSKETPVARETHDDSRLQVSLGDSRLLDSTCFMDETRTCAMEVPQHFRSNFTFQPLTETEMRGICDNLGFSFIRRDHYGLPGVYHVGVPPKAYLPVGADGNCFYHAVSQAISGSETNHERLRVLLIAYIQQHPDIFPGYADRIIRRIRGQVDAGYAGDSEATAMARMLGVSIHIFWHSVKFGGREHRQYIWEWHGKDATEINVHADNPGIYLLHCDASGKPRTYQENNHFNLVTHIS